MLRLVASTFLVRADCKGEVSASTRLVTKDDKSIPLPDWLTLEMMLLPESATYIPSLRFTIYGNLARLFNSHRETVNFTPKNCQQIANFLIKLVCIAIQPKA